MGRGTGEKPKKVQGSYTGIYSFDHMLTDNPKYPLAIYTSKEGEGFGTYELEMETFIALERPDKIKVKDTIEVIE
ncbi:MAG: hypothetical protein GF329_09735 [Candidatus Lokiarchaeota archaeon]|nr:hypothetical protein [Candidatus Lokiarchaeota archaeon]